MAKLIENAQLLARATREAAAAMGLELFAPGSPGAAVTAVKAPAGMDSGVIVKNSAIASARSSPMAKVR